MWQCRVICEKDKGTQCFSPVSNPCESSDAEQQMPETRKTERAGRMFLGTYTGSCMHASTLSQKEIMSFFRVA